MIDPRIEAVRNVVERLCGTQQSAENFACRIIAAADSAQAQQAEVHQWQKRGTWGWYDGHPDREDGGGPYDTRVLYTAPPQAQQAEPLNYKQIMDCARNVGWPPSMISGFVQAKLEVFARAIEQEHGIVATTVEGAKP